MIRRHLILLFSVLTLFSCTKGSHDGEMQGQIERNITGRWKAVGLAGVESATNDRLVLNYESRTKSSKSSSKNDNGGCWMNKMPFTCGISGNVITEINILATPSNVFETVVGEISASSMTATVKHTRGSAEVSSRDFRFQKITEDYAKSILGTWEGTGMTGDPVYCDENHRWEFLSNGTFCLYTRQGVDVWVKETLLQSEYVVDGNWLATRWTDASGHECHECWDVDGCDCATMNWSARRRTLAGGLVSATMSLKKVGEEPGSGDIYNLACYNIRYNSSDDTGDRDWSSGRKSLVSQLIRDRDFDVCGFVEVTQSVMANDLKSLLGDKYSFKFCGRNNGGNSGEAVGFGYKTDKFTMSKSGYFFLNTHPATAGEASEWADPAVTYNRSRIAAWGLLKDKDTGKQILYIVSHFELNKGMRAGSAKLIIQKAKELAPAGVPAFFCGDLNAAPSEASCCDTLSRYFADSYNYAVANSIPREGQVTTYNGFNTGVGKNLPSKRIDYMYFKGDNVTLKKYGVIYDLINGKLPSDHYPIYVTVALK